MNIQDFKNSVKKYKPEIVKARKLLEPYIYIDEVYEDNYDGINAFLIYNDHFYIAEYNDNGKMKYSLVMANEDWYDEDLDKLENLLYEYVKDHIGFSKVFYWNEETLNFFRKEYKTKNKCLAAVKDFVKKSCDLEDGETENDLVIDLMYKIYKQK